MTRQTPPAGPLSRRFDASAASPVQRTVAPLGATPSAPAEPVVAPAVEPPAAAVVPSPDKIALLD